jgi:hypothetical protein
LCAPGTRAATQQSTHRQASDLHRYVATASEIVTGWASPEAPYASAFAIGQSAQRIAPPERTYVDGALLEEFQELDSASRWSLDKLVGLARELNGNYAAEHTYACHMLLRAILDHIPPAFGHTSFAQVVANHAWGTTDAKYAKKLTDYRNSSDDVLHRQIRTSPSRIGMDDLPPRPCINALLQELLTVLQTSNAASTP